MTQWVQAGMLCAAQAGGGGAEEAPSVWMQFFPLILIVGVFYVFLIRPVRQRQKRHDQLLTDLSNGDKVVTQGGIRGTVTGIHDDVVTLRVADNVRIELDKSAIAGLQPSEADSRA